MGLPGREGPTAQSSLRPGSRRSHRPREHAGPLTVSSASVPERLSPVSGSRPPLLVPEVLLGTLTRTPRVTCLSHSPEPASQGQPEAQGPP